MDRVGHFAEGVSLAGYFLIFPSVMFQAWQMN
nr:MAG TPA: hypothetical protein [Caudoviricetes sp.]